jgi:hypothetical protein
LQDDSLTKEYYTIVDIVKEFDRNLLTVKGWGVTLSLAGLGIGFQYQHYGLFIVAAISSLSFWAIEGVIKRHQMRYYVRMREIEFIKSMKEEDADNSSSPSIDWSWTLAPKYFEGKLDGKPAPPERYTSTKSYRYAWMLPHVFLPHLITVVAGCILFLLAIIRIIKMPL